MFSFVSPAEPVKAPWYIDLLNLNLNNHDLEEARRRIDAYLAAYRKDGTRITQNLEFDVASRVMAQD